MRVDIQFDSKAVQRALKGFESQMPFVAQQTINAVLVDMQTAQMNHSRTAFNIKNEGFLKRSNKVSFAKKTNLTGQFAIADMPGSRKTSDILVQHEDGGTKKPRGRSIAIPTMNVKRNARGAVPAGKRPRAVIDSGKAFPIQLHGRRFIATRSGPKKKPKLKVLFVLTPSARITPRLRFYDTGNRVIARVTQGHMDAAIKKAISTANLK